MDDTEPTIWAGLAAAQVTKVVIHYSGSGDDGSIWQTDFYGGDIEIVAPDQLEIDVDEWAYSLMSAEHIGFDNEGSDGAITVDVAARKAYFDHHWGSEVGIPEPFELTFTDDFQYTRVDTVPAAIEADSSKLGEAVGELDKALRVIVLTPGIRAFLMDHDPKALEQARTALGLEG